MKVVCPCSLTSFTWSAYPSFATKSSALQHQPMSEESSKGSQVPPAHQPLVIKCVVSTGGWHNRYHYGRESLQAAKVKFGKGNQDQKVFRRGRDTETASEFWHRHVGWVRESEQPSANTRAISTTHSSKWKGNKTYIPASSSDPHFQCTKLPEDTC